VRHRLLSIGVISLAGLIAGCGVQEREQGYLQRGLALFDRGDFDGAKLDFKNVLQIDEGQAQAWYGLARVEEKQGDYADAIGAYARVLQLNPTNISAKVRRGILLLASGRADTVRAEVSATLRRKPDDPAALTLRGAVRERQGHLDQAAADYAAVLKADPGQPDALKLLARLKLEQGDPSGARILLHRALAAHPGDVDLETLLAGVYQMQDEPQQARAMLEALVRQQPGVLAHRVSLAHLLVGQGKEDAAERLLREAVAAKPQEPKAKVSLVHLIAQLRGTDAARKALGIFIEEAPEQYALRFELADLERRAGRVEAAEATYREILARAGAWSGPGLSARSQIAVMRLAAGRLEQAQTLCAQVLKEDPANPDGRFVSAAIALRRNEPRQAEADLRALLKDRPASVRARRLLARAYAREKELPLAQKTLEAAIQVAPAAPGAYLQLAELRAADGDPAGALAVLEQLLARLPDNAAAQTAIARIQLEEGRWAALQETATRILRSRPRDALGLYLKGLALQGEDRLRESIPLFEAAHRKAPDVPEPILAVARSDLALNEPKEAEARVRALLARDPGNVAGTVLLGDVYLRMHRPAEAKRQFEQAIRTHPGSPIAYARLATLQSGAGDTGSAIATLRSGVEATGRNGFLLFRLGGALQAAGRDDQAAAAYEEVLSHDPHADAAANNVAMLLAANADGDPQRLRRALRLAKRFKDSRQPFYLDTLGWVYYRLGDLEKAARVLEKAASLAGPTPELQYHLGMTYLKLGEPEKAKRLLARAAAARSPFPGIEEARSALTALDSKAGEGTSRSPVPTPRGPAHASPSA
jgi:predicted Zn-dependent protease